GGDRDDLFDAGDGPIVCRLDRRARFPGHAGDRDADRGRRRGDEPARRYRLRGGQPADPPALMTRLARWIVAGLVACIAAIAIAAPLLAPKDPDASGIEMLAMPSAAHWLGTDDLGRDVLSRVIYGGRTSLAIGFGAALVAMAVGVPIGLVAGT